MSHGHRDLTPAEVAAGSDGSALRRNERKPHVTQRHDPIADVGDHDLVPRAARGIVLERRCSRAAEAGGWFRHSGPGHRLAPRHATTVPDEAAAWTVDADRNGLLGDETRDQVNAVDREARATHGGAVGGATWRVTTLAR
jgi:hypothetical protein